MENKEREISLIELFWKIVLAWRAWLVCGVVFALLLAGVGYMRDMNSYRAAVASIEQEKETEEQDAEVEKVALTKDERQQVQDAKSLRQLMNKNRTYLKESILMNIDPYEENALILQYYIDSDYTWNINDDIGTDYTSAVTNAYAEYVKGGAVAKKIQSELGTDAEERYIEELISVKELESEVKADDILTIQIVYTDADVLEQIAPIVKECLESQTSVIRDTVGKHTLKLLSENAVVQTDSELVTRQANLQNQMNAYRSQLNTLLSTMSEAQLAELDIVLAREEEESEEEAEELIVIPEKPAFRVKYLVLGFMAGVFAVVLWVCCVAIFTGKLQNSQDLEKMYELRLFGNIRKKKKEPAGLDKVLLNIKNRKQKQFSEEASFQFLVSNLELTCKAEKATEIFLTGTEIERMERAWIDRFMARMDEQGIHVTYGENVCYDAATLRSASEMGHAVLLEEVGTSIYDEIAKEIKTLREQNVRILGCIGVE